MGQMHYDVKNDSIQTGYPLHVLCFYVMFIMELKSLRFEAFCTLISHGF